MTNLLSSRGPLRVAMASFILACAAASARAAVVHLKPIDPAYTQVQTEGTQTEAAPIERRPAPTAATPAAVANPPATRGATARPPGAPANPGVAVPQGGQQPGGPHLGGRKGAHLAQWMNQHSGLTLEQQERALELEPGFKELPMPTQQRMQGRLAQLYEMSPLQRQRIIEHTEAMERLTVEQRSQVRGAMQQLSALPPEQRRAVARSFRELRQLPPQQRMRAMLAPRYAWLNQAQRSTLTRLIQVAPMLPMQ